MVRFPEVQLYVDGTLFKNEKKNPEVIDDWPLHPTKGINTTLTVGACWQGKFGLEQVILLIIGLDQVKRAKSSLLKTCYFDQLLNILSNRL